MAIDCRSLRKSSHVLCCVTSGRGHVTATVNLAKAMARVGMSMTIVFSSASAYASVAFDKEGDANAAEGLDIAFVLLEGSREIEGWEDGNRVLVKGVRKFSLASNLKLRTDFAAEERALEDLILAMQTPPLALISDMVVAWSASPANKLNLKSFVFYPSAPFYLAALLKATSLILEGVDPTCHTGLEIEKDLPVIPWPQVPDFVKERDHLFFNSHLQLFQSDGILLNTFKELDGKVLEALEHMPEAKGIQFFPVGPLVHPLFLDPDTSPEKLSGAVVFKGSKKGHMQCLDWLEKRTQRTVLFLCFGSWETLEDAQIVEIAKGLEASTQPFIWVTAESSIAALPEGFQARMENQGLVVSGWAPQQLILRHPAIGGFLTHCGWNSIVECISMAGIPLVCWPLGSDQPFVCRYVVDELKIGIEVEATAEGFVGAEEVERCARIVMEKRSGIRQRAAALKNSALLPQSGLSSFLKRSILSV